MTVLRNWLGLCLGSAIVGAASAARGDEPPPPATLVDHPTDTRYYVGGQANLIEQGNASFPAAYSGPNSLLPNAQAAASYVMTLYLGASLTKTTEVFFDGEVAAGGGISQALGLAGFTNLDVVRNPSLGSEPYPARFLIKQVIPLSKHEVELDRGHLQMATKAADERIEIRVGKLSTVDRFDLNSVGSDSHTQFLNWTVDNNGAYDYAADTRGYTYGAIVELETPRVALRFGEMLMPTVANGIDLDWHLDQSRGENLELELRESWWGGRRGVLRLLGFVNHANMGLYSEAIAAYLAGIDPTPDITKHRKQGRVKVGLGLNAEHELTDALRVFLRAGFNGGDTESFAYTEVNDTVAAGADLRGVWWKRPNDKVGLALVTNGLSAEHRRYLALGGLGFLLGDGALSYEREDIAETYYTAWLYRGVTAAFDFQGIVNPGYNAARGPVAVFSGRLHLEF